MITPSRIQRQRSLSRNTNPHHPVTNAVPTFAIFNSNLLHFARLSNVAPSQWACSSRSELPDGSAIARGQNDRSDLLDDEVLDLVLLLVRVVLATDADKFVPGLEGLLFDGLGDLDKEGVGIRQDRDTDKLRRSFARRVSLYFFQWVFT